MNSTITRALLLLLCSSIIGTTGKRERTRSRAFKRRSRQLDAVNGGYSDWYLYSLCNSHTCTETWTRYCNSPRPQNGGDTCKGDSFKKEHCRDDSKCVTETEAPTPSKHVTETVKSQWSRWGPCSVSCGVGIRNRVMLPCKDADNCETQEQPCLKRSCQLDNGYGDWSDWGTCENCVQSRTRECVRSDICSFKQETETRRCYDCVLDTETMTECQKTLHEHTNFGRTGYRIECTGEGEFAPIQCDKSMEKCWCVNQTTGRQIYGTHHPSHMNGIYNCEKLSKMTHCAALQQVGLMNIVASDYIPQCEEDGSFVPQQYNDEVEIRWCVYSDGLEIPGTRVSINDAVACDPELSQKTKCNATAGADCSDEGAFHSTQCFMDEEWRVCRCVFVNGLTKDSTEMTTEIPECSAYPDLSLTKCQALSLVSLTVLCLPSGEFAPEFCSQTVCYCVNSDGSMVPGSSSPVNGQRRTSCEDLIKMNEGNHNSKTERTTIFTEVPDVTSAEYFSSSVTYRPLTDIPVVDITHSTDYPFGITTSSGGFPGELTSTEYNAWSDWSPCSVDCGGGYTSASRSCPLPNNACGGPDIAKKWDSCNTVPCLEAAIEVLEYEWSADSKHLTVTCAALGLPKPYVVIRNNTGFISEDDQIEYIQEDGRILVRYRITPRENTTLTCIATGEGQARKNIGIVVKPGKVDSFTASSPAIYLGQEVTLRCSVVGLPRPDIRLLENGVTLEEKSSEELVRVVHPTENTEYSCSAIHDGLAEDSSPPLTVVVIDPCVAVECQEHARCEVESDGNTTCTCKTCEGDDLDSVEPVCASNCQTYLNACDMERSSCLDSVYLYSIYSGSCSNIEAPVVTSTCPEEEILEGSDVLLECTATGIWDTAVWSKDGVRVGRGKRLRLSDVATTDSGIYTCTFTGCGGTVQSSCPVRVQKKDTEECIQYGAGHFHQFSGASFNYPGVCHYVLAMDCHYGSFYIYTGTSHCGSDEVPLAYASSVTVYVGWDAVVLLRGFDVNEFGVMKHLSPGSELIYQNFRIWRERDILYLTHPATNFTLSWDGLTVVSLTMSKSYAGALCGLCGDVGVEYNEVEDPQSHGASYEVDRYDKCNVADIPVNTCASQLERDAAETACFETLYSETLSKCHGVVPVEEYMETCIYDTCGVKWLSSYHTGLCNVLTAYSIVCEDMGVDLRGWRDETPCPREIMHRVSYMSKKRRRRKRSVGFSDHDIMLGGD